MRYDKSIDSYVKNGIDDGYGGILNGEQFVQSIDCEIIPVKIETLLKSGREISYNILKVFTKEQILYVENLEEQQKLVFKYLGNDYKLSKYTDYTKIKMLVLKVIK